MSDDKIAEFTEQTTHGELPLRLPLRPVVRIRPVRNWLAIDWKDLWEYRELLYFLTWRDLKVRYKQTVLGVAWAVIQPLFAMVIFTLFFGRLAKVPSENIPYPAFVYAGLLLWTFFSNAVTSGSNSLVSNSNLLTKVYFPRILVPGAAVAAALVDLFIAFAVLVGMLVYYRISFTWALLAVPGLIALTTLLSFGVGVWFAALNVKYRDIRFALPFLIQLWMFVSPVIYPASLMPEKWRWVLALNPLTGIIEAFRTAVFGQRSFDLGLLATSAALTLAISLYGIYSFWRMEESFSDIV